MRALTWQGPHEVRVETLPDPEIVNPRDAIIEVTSAAICGSDLHLFDGVIPGLQSGDVLGHECTSRVVETGPESTLQKGQRVVVPFTISCGGCLHCKLQQYSACANSNPVETQDLTEPLCGHALSETILALRKGGRVSIPGVYGGFLDKFPLGAMMEKGLQIRTGQTHVQRCLKELLHRIGAGEIDSRVMISHRLPLEEAARGYENFKNNQNDWTKVVLKPGTAA